MNEVANSTIVEAAKKKLQNNLVKLTSAVETQINKLTHEKKIRMNITKELEEQIYLLNSVINSNK